MILKSAQFFYDILSELKNKFYEKNMVKKIKLKTPVISIGNLSVGGTGKTPCVQYIALALLKKGSFKKICIVSRSYKALLKSPQKVELSKSKSAQFYGDESCLLQKNLPQCSVWSGPKKYQTALAAEETENPDLIIIDDGFSHRRLDRQFDLVLIDASVPLSEFQTLPVGRLRESLSHLQRAHAILITKSNLVNDEKIKKIMDLILKQKNIAKANIYLAEGISDLNTLESQKDDLFVFCGLGKPESFKASLTKLGFLIVHFQIFSDHYSYTNKDLNQLAQAFKIAKEKNSRLKLVTTSKDLVKINSHPILDDLYAVDYHLKIADNEEGSLIEKISRTI